jgi:hypothetical protein
MRRRRENYFLFYSLLFSKKFKEKRKEAMKGEFRKMKIKKKSVI